MPVPNTFANATSAIPLSQLDNNFATAITIGNTAVQLGNTVTTLNNMTLANVTISSVASAITVAQGGTGLTTATAANNAIYSTGATTLTAGTLPVAAGGTGATTLTAENVVLGNSTSAVKFVAPGSSGNVLTSNGTTWVSQAAGGGGTANVQTFTSSGTWTKPSGFGTTSRVLIQAWSGGGSGGRNSGYGGGGGGGGAYKERWLPLSSLGATETVTVGAGGAAKTTDGNGNVGGNTTVGSLITAYGGGPGGQGYNFCCAPFHSGGGGGGIFSPGKAPSGQTYWGAGGTPDGGGGPIGSNDTARNTYVRVIAPNSAGDDFWINDAFSPWAGGGGGGIVSSIQVQKNGGRAVYGGGGGGGSSYGTTPGTSEFGGAGGNASTAGSQPSGGGGGSTSTSGAGGAGQVIITVFPG
jgi:hypothetical protein